ncbi:hypothetical protein [Microbacterium flavum]|uniref:ABC transporter permease n=1 Tax=Microbacterium flavum TaxID=415216 RepID=A0ABS5XTF9_9MICO|nr:hypothetical protein [Microbacterium flavum]MBT8797819.1 hypothetical protein [Microbacterium flavum]
MNRTLTVTRLQFVNRYTFVWLPLIILGGSFALSLMIFALIPYDGVKIGGGTQAPIWYFFAVGIMSLSYTFPFSQALSITRREFFLGTMLAAVGTALILGAVFVVGGALEQATGGWGINGYFFYLEWVWRAGALAAGAFYAVCALLLFVIGFLGSTIYKRAGALGLTVVLVGTGLLLVAAIWLIGRADAWTRVGEWMAGLSVPALIVGMLVATVAVGGIAFATLRRATP